MERDLVGLGGVTGRVRPRRALCAGCGVSRVLLPDSMLRRRQYGVEVIWAGLLAAARGRPWNQVAAGVGGAYTAGRGGLRRVGRPGGRGGGGAWGAAPPPGGVPGWAPRGPGAA